MDFSLKKQTSGKAPLGKALTLTAALSLMVLISGCTGQPTKIETNNPSLLSEPVVDQKLVEMDFAFPSQRPSLMRGREIFQQQCVKCHAASYWQSPKVKQDLAYTTPIDNYLMLTTGKAPQVVMPNAQRKQLLPASHPGFKNEINRDDRWAVIFYTRYLAGAGDIKSPDPKTDVAAIFGGNCAVCHGQNGEADGPLFTGKTGNHELHNAEQVHNFMPPPANFRQYNRVYNRTDAQLFKYICEGVYPSAMPAWYGDVNLDKDTGKVTYVFNEALISNLVRHVRSLAYTNDLKQDLPEAITPPPGLPAIDACHPAPTNQPWTNAMRANPQKNKATMPQADSISGGMVLGPAHGGHPVPVIHTDDGADHASMEGKDAE